MSIPFYNYSSREINFTDSNNNGFYCNQQGNVVNLCPVAANQFIYKSGLTIDIPEYNAVHVYSTVGSDSHVLCIDVQLYLSDITYFDSLSDSDLHNCPKWIRFINEDTGKVFHTFYIYSAMNPFINYSFNTLASGESKIAIQTNFPGLQFLEAMDSIHLIDITIA